jgi:hypothetical protein
MVDDVAWAALPDHYLQGIEDQFGAEMVSHGPVDNLAAPGVENHGEMQKSAAMGTNVMPPTQS